MKISTLKELYKSHKEYQLSGRFVSSELLKPLLENLKSEFKIESIGTSVLGEEISVIKCGRGKIKIFMWSQMHGNESTTTKAIFDLCNAFSKSTNNSIQSILDACTIAIIPQLNPDGSNRYTRTNANDIDLNRDAQALSQPESRALRQFFNQFKPDYCFNLHGQRTIFSAGHARYPATVSFLAPAQDQLCSITETRKKAMSLIVKMNDFLQNQIPHHIGIYDDAYNPNCVGDTFQSLNVPTVLFEAGHYHNDYSREIVREYMFQSLLISLYYIAFDPLEQDLSDLYAKIPENEKLFFDLIIRNTILDGISMDIAIQYEERLVGSRVKFIPIIEKIEPLPDYFGHREIDAHLNLVLDSNRHQLIVGNEIDFVLINNEIFSLNPKKI